MDYDKLKATDDWELDRIQRKVEELGGEEKIEETERKLLTIEMLKALQLDIQEGRIEAFSVSVVGGENEEHIKHFQWIMCGPDQLPEIQHAVSDMLKMIEAEMKTQILKRIKSLFEG